MRCRPLRDPRSFNVTMSAGSALRVVTESKSAGFARVIFGLKVHRVVFKTCAAFKPTAASLYLDNSYEALFQNGCLFPYGVLDFAAAFFVVGSKLYSWVVCALRWV